MNLIVPVDVQALRVLGPGNFSGPTTDFSGLPWNANDRKANLGTHVTQPLWEPPIRPLANGVHLHWQLPAGLTRGVSSGGRVSFPAAPNRWLVTRLLRNTAAPLSVAQWVVESDALMTAAEYGGNNAAGTYAAGGRVSITVPIGWERADGSDGSIAYREPYGFLGRVFPLDAWPAAGTRHLGDVAGLDRLRAVGPSGPVFAAYYPDCASVFGFHDAFADDPAIDLERAEFQVSYHVAGWYANAADDPLTTGSPADYGWTCGAESGVPKRSLYAGRVTNLAWSTVGDAPARTYPSAHAADVGFRVAIGNSTSEALAALLADEWKSWAPQSAVSARADIARSLEALLEAVQLGLMERLGKPDFGVRLEQTLHQQGFAATPGGSRWIVRATGNANAEPDGANVASALAELNATQDERDVVQSTIASMQRQLFLDWYKYVDYLFWPLTRTPPIKPGELADYCVLQMVALRSAAATAVTLSDRLTAQTAALRHQLEETGTPHELQQTDAARFWEPHDPVLVLSADALQPARRNASAALLLGRLSNDIPAPSGSAHAAGARVPAIAPLDTDLAALVDEAFSQVSAANPTAAWDDPFLPVYLVWQAEYAPYQTGASAADGYDRSFLTAHFGIDPHVVDLAVANAPADGPDTWTIRGAVPLSWRAAQPLIKQIPAAPEGLDPALGAALTAHFAERTLLSQGLDGFNDALLTRAPGLQMSPCNPFFDLEMSPAKLGADPRARDAANSLTGFVARSVGSEADQMPIGQTAPFTPLCAGHLTLSRIMLVDVFGRRATLMDRANGVGGEHVVASARLRPASPLHDATFRPRFMQPARLQFRWLPASADGSPICGWVLPNHLDNSLMLFTRAGTPCGALGVFGAQKTVTWQPGPGLPTAADLARFPADDAEFAKFAAFVWNKPATFFDALMGAIENAHTFILPAGNDAAQAQAVLMGRPLALVRAGLRLELEGLPAFDTSVVAAAADVRARGSGYEWRKRSQAGLSSVDVPVRIGDPDHIEDGLVAFYLDDGRPIETLFAPAAPVKTAGIGPPSFDTVTLNVRARSDPGSATLALLIDPRAAVHASTGVLPVKAIDIPAELYAPALRAIEFAFFTGAVVRVPMDRTLPIPTEPGYDWIWRIAQPAGAGTLDLDVVPAQLRDRARFSYGAPVIEDGWLALHPSPPKKNEKGVSHEFHRQG